VKIRWETKDILKMGLLTGPGLSGRKERGGGRNIDGVRVGEGKNRKRKAERAKKGTKKKAKKHGQQLKKYPDPKILSNPLWLGTIDRE